MKFIKDERFFSGLQMQYRVEIGGGLVIGFIRKVNHGQYPWIPFLPNGEKRANETHRDLAGRTLLLTTTRFLNEASR